MAAAAAQTPGAHSVRVEHTYLSALKTGTLNVLALGPLTNIALAARMDAQFASNVHRLVVMGGAEGPGNVTPTAEYNFHNDAEAAHVVFDVGFPATTVITWECGVRHALPWDWVAGWYADKVRSNHAQAAAVTRCRNHHATRRGL